MAAPIPVSTQIAVCGVMMVITWMTRALPFWGFERQLSHPKSHVLGHLLPPCILLILAVHALHVHHFIEPPYGIPEIAGITVLLALQHRWHHMLLSLLGGMCTVGLLYALVSTLW